MNRKQAIEQFLNKVRDAYIQDQRQKGIRASGRSAEALRIDPAFDYGRLYGSSYMQFQASGRRPGKFPPLEAIIEWMRHKGIRPTDITEKSLAFLIARKIARAGTDIYQGKRPALNVEDKILEYRKELAANLLKGTREEIIQRLRIRR